MNQSLGQLVSKQNRSEASTDYRELPYDSLLVQPIPLLSEASSPQLHRLFSNSGLIVTILAEEGSHLPYNLLNHYGLSQTERLSDSDAFCWSEKVPIGGDSKAVVCQIKRGGPRSSEWQCLLGCLSAAVVIEVKNFDRCEQQFQLLEQFNNTFFSSLSFKTMIIFVVSGKTGVPELPPCLRRHYQVLGCVQGSKTKEVAKLLARLPEEKWLNGERLDLVAALGWLTAGQALMVRNSLTQEMLYDQLLSRVYERQLLNFSREVKQCYEGQLRLKTVDFLLRANSLRVPARKKATSLARNVPGYCRMIFKLEREFKKVESKFLDLNKARNEDYVGRVLQQLTDQLSSLEQEASTREQMLTLVDEVLNNLKEDEENCFQNMEDRLGKIEKIVLAREREHHIKKVREQRQRRNKDADEKSLRESIALTEGNIEAIELQNLRYERQLQRLMERNKYLRSETKIRGKGITGFMQIKKRNQLYEQPEVDEKEEGQKRGCCFPWQCLDFLRRR